MLNIQSAERISRNREVVSEADEVDANTDKASSELCVFGVTGWNVDKNVVQMVLVIDG